MKKTEKRENEMKGLELSEKFYREYGEKMIAENFSEFEGKIACGLAGSGSECFGFDDDISADHDFEPGFCMFVPDGLLDSKTEYRLERAYAKLPEEFEGFKRSKLSPVGGNRHGLIYIGDFLEARTGTRDGKLSLSGWLSIPSHYLAEVVNGKIFRDDSGFFSSIRESFKMPEDARRKKLAGELLLMNQSGQYNYMRCIEHGEPAAAQLAALEFVKHTLSAVFLLNDRFMPYYKWQFRALKELPILGNLGDSLYFLMSYENSKDYVQLKCDMIEDVASLVITALQDQSMTKAICGDLEKHAYSVNDSIKDASLRNANILAAVSD